MRPRLAIYGEVARKNFVVNQGFLVSEIERGLLLGRLLLFDQVIIRSVRLKELPFLIKMFGQEGLRVLLEKGVLKLSSDTVMIATDVQMNGRRQLPLLQFTQGVIDTHNREEYVIENLRCLLQVSGLSNPQRNALSDLVIGTVVSPGKDYGTELLKQVRKDLSSNVDLMRSLLIRGASITENQSRLLQTELREVSPGVQRLETNIQKLLGVSVEQEHLILSDAVTAATNLNQRLADMRNYGAISQFEDSEVPFLFGKIHGIVNIQDPSLMEKLFLRVISYSDIPSFLETGKIDVDKLLRVRESTECREFREWLSTTHEIDDLELKRLLTGFKAQAAQFIASPLGRGLRFAANVGLGFIPHYATAASIAEGAVDNFLLDKLLPSSGVLTFLSRSVPSIFKSAYP